MQDVNLISESSSWFLLSLYIFRAIFLQKHISVDQGNECLIHPLYFYIILPLLFN